MASTATAGPSQSQELGTPSRSFASVARTLIQGSSSDGFLGALAGSWAEQGAAGIQTTCEMPLSPAATKANPPQHCPSHPTQTFMFSLGFMLLPYFLQ